MKILLIDDQIAVSRGFQQIAQQRLAASVAVASTADQAGEAIDGGAFDLVIAESLIGQEDTLAVLTGGGSRLSFPVVVFTANDNPTFIARACAVGVRAYLSKSASTDELVRTIQQASSDRAMPADGRIAKVRKVLTGDSSQSRIFENLTNREDQVLRHLGLGLSNREIASSLSISVETVKEHVQNVLRKIDAGDRTEAAVLAVRSGLVNFD